MGGRGSGGDRNSTSREEPVLGITTYKATQEMKDTVMQMAKDVQKDFPLLDRSFTINFSKYLSHAAETMNDTVDFKGSIFKTQLAKGNTAYLKGLTAHELTHVMQNRIGLRGLAKQSYIEDIWNRAVDKYLAQHSDKTIAQVDEFMARRYGNGSYSRIGSTPVEKMAVAIQSVYQYPNSKGDVGVEIGKYLAAELKKMKEKK